MNGEHDVVELRRSIDSLPERTRRAMLIGIENNTVIAGAFSGGGGICPMLAAHRAGGRASCISFPDAWDRFTGVWGRNIVRPATQYEIDILRREIEASLVPQESDLAAAIAEYRQSVEARRRRDRFSAGDAVDLGAAIEEHKRSARRRRSREADDIGVGWLFEETLVLPDDFDARPAADEPEPEPRERRRLFARR